MHFQINDLCDAASDQAKREVLEHLPEGLHETYFRILSKIAEKTINKNTVIKVLKWMACARRSLTLEELREAVAFDEKDRSWNPDKIPVGDCIISSCLGLVIREKNSKVRFAHHSILQYILVDTYTDIAVRSSSEVAQFHFKLAQAEEMACTLCATYLCFSDFESAVAVRNERERKINLVKLFQGRGPISIAGSLGLGAPLHAVLCSILGSQGKVKIPDIDYAKYLKIRVQMQPPPIALARKFAFLGYVMDHWQWHTRWMSASPDSLASLSKRFGNLIQSKILPFEFRPWGQNQHFGFYGCKGCPIPASVTNRPEHLPLIGLIHWSAEKGHLYLLESIPESLLKSYLEHECYHNETFLIACRHGQDAVLKFLVKTGHDFHLEREEGLLQAVCASRSAASLTFLLTKDNFKSQEFYPRLDVQACGLDALYQAARDGHEKLAELLLREGVQTSVRKTDTNMTPLHVASRNGHASIVKSLLEYGADSCIRGGDHIALPGE